MPPTSQQLHSQLTSSSRANCFDPKQSDVVSLSRSSSFGLTKNLMFVLVDVDPLMRLSLATCLTGTHQSLSLTVFSRVGVSITRTSYCFESRSKLFIPAGLCCSQPLPDVFQPSPSDRPFPTVQPLLSFQPLLSPFFPFPFVFPPFA